jgi:hypothetical protein
MRLFVCSALGGIARECAPAFKPDPWGHAGFGAQWQWHGVPLLCALSAQEKCTPNFNPVTNTANFENS